MKKAREIINTNIRLNLLDEQDRQAYEYLNHMDRTKYKSYSRAVVTAVNDYFARQEKLEDDPYLESREKEDVFLQKVLDTIEKGAREATPLVLAEQLVAILAPYFKAVTISQNCSVKERKTGVSDADSDSENLLD